MSATPTEVETRLQEGLVRLGVTPTPELVVSLLAFLALLQKWNRAFNLTSLTDPDDMVVRHILDSVAAGPFLRGATVLDVGSGAGLPGIPLALTEPGRQFTLLDSSGKKVRFLRQTLMELVPANVRLAQARAENWRAETLYGTVICRAFGELAQFVKGCGRLVADGGRLVAMKGRYPSDELQQLPLPWRATEVARVEVPFLQAERHVVVLER